MNKITRAIALMLWMTVACVGYAQETVTVDLSVNNGPATYRASGFLHGMNATVPAPSLVSPLKAKLFRGDDNESGLTPGVIGVSPAAYSRVTGQGAIYMFILGDAFIDNVGGYNPSNARIVTSATMSQWTAFVAAYVQAAVNAGQNIQWDIWNEPNQGEFWTGSEAQYLAAWQAAVTTIRGISPNQVIVGPSTDGIGLVTDLLSFGTSNNVLPNVVAWHELSGVSSLVSDVATVKSYLAANNPSITTLDITEMTEYSETYIPGTNIQYLAAVERAQLTAAAHACWNNDCGEGGPGPDLDGLLQTNGTTTDANWFAYQAYANITGTIVGVAPSATVDGISGQDPVLQQAYSVFGRNGASTNVTFTYTNISSAPYLNVNGVVHAQVYSLANDGGSGSSGPTSLSEADVPVSGNSISVTVPSMGTNDVAIVQLTPGGGSSANRPSPPTITAVTVH